MKGIRDKMKVEKIARKLGFVVFPCTIDIHDTYAYAQEKPKGQFMIMYVFILRAFCVCMYV